MPPKGSPSELPVHSFRSAAKFQAFLDLEHLTLPGFHLKLAKKTSGIPSITGAEAIEVALCYGWIDGQSNGLDHEWWTVRYTPRRPKSIWSQKNVGTVARLVAEGRMRPAGLAAVEAAKADGRWQRAYAGPATITVPADLIAALSAEATADAFFASLNKSDRYSVLWRVETASINSRAKRIDAIVQMLATGTVPGATAKPSKKRKEVTTNKNIITETKVEKQPIPKDRVLKAQGMAKTLADRPRRPGLRERPG